MRGRGRAKPSKCTGRTACSTGLGSISPEAREANDVVRHVIEELRYLKASCPDAIITVENPATGELKNYKPWKDAGAASWASRRST